MVGCGRPSEHSVEEVRCTEGVPAVKPWFPHKAFWVSVVVCLLVVLIALVLTGNLGNSGMLEDPAQSIHIVRITGPDPTGTVINQSTVVDKENDLVTFSVTSPSNLSSTVLFDVKHGLVCYKPANQETCFLREMDQSDYQRVGSVLPESTHQMSQFQLSGSEIHRQTEFLGVLGGRGVNVSTLEEPFQALCRDSPVHWTRRAEGPGRQRLVYFCIDICFPSNICVSVCFYYLPE
ncbi:unnamed protein product [Arctogadus glacialis]